MGIFRKLLTGIDRAFDGKKIESISEMKAFGNCAERSIVSFLRRKLPDAIIKENVILEKENHFSEIDCLIQYENKLFILEIKNWKGEIIERDGRFFSYKRDKYTDEIHEKELKSPFPQVKRQISLLKEITNSKPYINPVVLFENSDKVDAENEIEWFINREDLLKYLKNNGRESNLTQIEKSMKNIKTADFIFSNSLFGERSLHCLINDESLTFKTNKRILRRKDIRYIKIVHHFSYDDIIIDLKNGDLVTTRNENGVLIVKDNKTIKEFSLSKIDSIELGR